MKLESSYVRLSNAKAGAACVSGWRWGRGLPYVLAAVCASFLLVGASAGDHYQCYQEGRCSPALSSQDECEEDRDYVVTVANAGSGVTVLSFHGGEIEPGTSEISSEVARRYGWNRYDLNANGTPQCLSPYDSNFKKLHITSTKFDDPRAVALVAAHPKAVAIHGRSATYQKGDICVGGKDAAARSAFIDYVDSNAAAWGGYPLDAIDATTAASGDCSDPDLRGKDDANLVNRTSSRAGLQLELHPLFRDDLVNASSSFDDLRDIVYEGIRRAMVVPMGCLTVDGAGVTWQNRALGSNQTGRFYAEFDAAPRGGNIDAGVGLSYGAQTAYSGLACAVRFNVDGFIQARNGGTYQALSEIRYSPNKSYHFRFDVNVPAHTYSVYVTPEGDTEEVVVGSDFAFRTEQANVSGLNNWSLFGESGAMRVCELGAPCSTAAVGGGWINNSFAAQSGTFTAQWDATPLKADIDAVVGLSNGAQTSFPGFAALVRFNSDNKIDARDGGTYRAASVIPYAPNTTYHFRLSVNVPAHTYSVYVTPAGGTEQVVGLNYAFRTEQSAVGSLNYYGFVVDSTGTDDAARVCNFAVSSNTLFQDSFTGADGLTTNEYAHWNSDGILSPDWDMTSGTLFRQSNTGWTGLPDSPDAPNKFSSDRTNSDVFRLTTLRSFAGNIKVSLALKNNNIQNPNCGASNTCWHGVHIWLRHLTQYDIYYVSVNRADNKVVIKRKVPCGPSNGGFYKELAQVTRAWTTGTWQHFSATIKTNGDGSVTIKVYDAAVNPNSPFLQATDGGGTNTSWTTGCVTPGSYPTSQYPPITDAGSVGVRGDFVNFNIDDFRVSSF